MLPSATWALLRGGLVRRLCLVVCDFGFAGRQGALEADAAADALGDILVVLSAFRAAMQIVLHGDAEERGAEHSSCPSCTAEQPHGADVP